ncbi:MAG: peptide ABC transporter substrate-binding protein [bacterium]|nr:peptide ABC transporter substrate-binding protein [bacterium]
MSSSLKTKPKKDLTAKHVFQIAKKSHFPSWRQWKKFPELLTKKERMISVIAVTVGLLAFLSAGFSYYFTNRILVPAVGGEYTEGLVGEPQFVNPILSPASTVDMDITRLVFRGLFIFDPVLGLIPDLATSHEVSEDEKTYTITLRENVLWHDGEPMSAQDVAFTFQSIANPEYKSPLAQTFRGITVEVIDNTTVQFQLPEPFAPFLSSLTVGILPLHIWEGVAPKRALLTNLNLQPIGNGPYKFEKFSKDQNGAIRSYALTRNGDFYGEKPMLETVTFKFYSDLQSAIDALKNKNIEGLGFIPEDKTPDLEESRVVQLLRPTIPQETVIFLNEARNSILKDEDVRRALNMAIDRDRIIETVFHGNATPLSGPLLPGGSVEVPAPTELDFDGAIALLEADKWKIDPISTFRQKDIDNDDEPNQLTIELVTLDAPDMISVAEAIKQSWKVIGVNAQVRIVPQVNFNSEVIKPRAYDALLTGILFGADTDPFPFWHSSQTSDPGVNLAGYSNRKVDEALETARGTINEEARLTAYTAFQELIIEDIPALFLLQPTYPYAAASKIKGIELEHLIAPADRFNRIETWYTRTKKAFRPGE